MKHLLYLSAFLFVSTFAFAQDDVIIEHAPAPCFHIGHELILGHGFLPSRQGYSSGYYGYDYNYDNHRGTGAISLTYRYHFSRLLSLGITGVYDHQNGGWRSPLIFTTYDPINSYVPVDPIYSIPPANVRRSRYTIASEITFNYAEIGHGLVRFYSVVGLGYTFNYQTIAYSGSDTRYYTPDSRPVVFNGYISPFGIRFGRALGGFAEFGTGYKGVLNYGVSYKF